MLIGYSQPDYNVVWSALLPVDCGASYLTPASALVDGKPARVARLQWRDDALPAITDYVALNVVWERRTATGGFSLEPWNNIRIVALLGLVGVPPGCKIELRGRRPADDTATYALGGNALTQTAVELADGSVACWWVLDAGNDPLNGLEFRIFNDVAASTVFSSASTIDIGEAVFMEGVEIAIETGWNVRLVDPSAHQRTQGSQLNSVTRRSYREINLQLTNAPVAEARGGGLANGSDWETIQNRLVGSARGVMIPRYGTAADLDTDELHRTAVYGRLAPGSTVHQGGDYYGVGWSFEEIPPA